jgi:hypothetical protein
MGFFDLGRDRRNVRAARFFAGDTRDLGGKCQMRMAIHREPRQVLGKLGSRRERSRRERGKPPALFVRERFGEERTRTRIRLFRERTRYRSVKRSVERLAAHHRIESLSEFTANRRRIARQDTKHSTQLGFLGRATAKGTSKIGREAQKRFFAYHFRFTFTRHHCQNANDNIDSHAAARVFSRVFSR